MKIKNEQITFDDMNPEYKEFLDKFKPKKTTDDCYTPKNVFDAILSWCMSKYGFDADDVIRPFWPGADFMKCEYPTGCVVVDNPPFSIVSKIVNTYNENGIRFFLFCPSLTSIRLNGTLIVTDTDITYENGANIRTAFVTNMEPGIKARTDIELKRIIQKANNENLMKIKRNNPKYEYPYEVLTMAHLQYLASHDTEFVLRERDVVAKISALDSQKEKGKSVFGDGLLITHSAAAERAAAERTAAERAAAERTAAERAAAERTAAERWKLSEREEALIQMHERNGESE